MIAIELEYPSSEHEAQIVRRESGQDATTVGDLLRLAQAVRKVAHPGMREVCSTRTLVAAARLMRAGLTFRDAAIAAIAGPLSDDQDLRRGLVAMIDSYAD
jgi:nitric oxide reductase NorQ protein